jgi:hypothetical protein
MSWHSKREFYPKLRSYTLQEQCLLKLMETRNFVTYEYFKQFIYVEIVFYYTSSCHIPNCEDNQTTKKRRLHYMHEHVIPSCSLHFKQAFLDCCNFSLPIYADQINANERRIFCTDEQRFKYVPVTKRKLFR